MTSVREKLRQGSPVIGSWVNTASPIVAEIMAGAGLDFLTVDVEHSPVELPQAAEIFRAVRSGNPRCESFVRLPDCDYATAKRYLDAGATGLIAPLVCCPKQAGQLVSAAKYPPVGRRGVGFCRANGYGVGLSEAVETANDEILVAVQIEDRQGVENVDDILAVEGVDAAFIGPYDLSASLGVTAQFDHPRMIEARQKVLDACTRHGVAAGIHVVPPDPSEVGRCIEQGYRLIAYSLDITMLTRACYEGVAALQEFGWKPNRETS